MNNPHVLTGSRRKPVLLTIVLAACIAAFSLVSAQALAGTGGAGPDGGDSATSSTKKHPTTTKSRYSRIWDRVSRRNKRWASRTARCESGKDPNAIGGGGRYRGAFQFMKSTWRTSPKSPGGDPIDYSYKTQAVVAVKLKKRDGAGHWPVCG